MISVEKIRERAGQEKVSAGLVLKEQIHLLVLDYLFKAAAFSHLVFQGGTALKIVYQGVRYSEDLDFVLRRGHSRFWARIPKLLEKLPSALGRHLLFAGDIRLKAQKKTRTFQRFVLSLKADAFRLQDRTQVEIANIPSYENQSLIIRGGDAPVSPAIRVETPVEILADKLTAFGLREYVKGRDIWDIHFLTASMNLAADEKVRQLVKRKVSDYRSTAGVFAAGFSRNLSILEDRGSGILKVEMEKFLPGAYQDQFRLEYRAINHAVFGLLKSFFERWKKSEG